MPDLTSKPVTTKDKILAADATAHLVAGKRYSGNIGGAELEDLCERVDELSEELGVAIVVLAPGDYREEGFDSEIYEVIVGLEIAETRADGPARVDYDTIHAKLARAATLPWERISGFADSGELQQALRDQTVAVFAIATGPRAGVHVAYGVRIDDEDDVHPSGLLQSKAPGLAIIRVQPHHAAHDDAIYGLAVAEAVHEDLLPIQLDVSEPAHAARMERLGPLAPRSSYFIAGHHA